MSTYTNIFRDRETEKQRVEREKERKRKREKDRKRKREKESERRKRERERERETPTRVPQSHQKAYHFRYLFQHVWSTFGLTLEQNARFRKNHSYKTHGFGQKKSPNLEKAPSRKITKIDDPILYFCYSPGLQN